MIIKASAWKDMQAIGDYYLIQSDAETALKVNDNILDVIQRMEDFPDSGSRTLDGICECEESGSLARNEGNVW